MTEPTTPISPGKWWGLRRLADDAGRFTMLAVDQRPPIKNLVAAARGTEHATFDDVAEVKRMLIEELGPEVLLDRAQRLGRRRNKLEQDGHAVDADLAAVAVAQRQGENPALAHSVAALLQLIEFDDRILVGDLAVHLLCEVQGVALALRDEELVALRQRRWREDKCILGRFSDSDWLTRFDEPLLDDLAILDNADPKDLGRRLCLRHASVPQARCATCPN